MNDDIAYYQFFLVYFIFIFHFRLALHMVKTCFQTLRVLAAYFGRSFGIEANSTHINVIKLCLNVLFSVLCEFRCAIFWFALRFTILNEVGLVTERGRHFWPAVRQRKIGFSI